jgi:hypothetical protein
LSLVPKEVNLLEPFVFNKLQTVALVPAYGKDVKGDLSPYGESQVEIEVLGSAFLAKFLDECGADVVFLGFMVNAGIQM